MRKSRLDIGVLLLLVTSGCIDTAPQPEEKQPASGSCGWPDQPGTDANVGDIAPVSLFYSSYTGGAAVLLVGVEGAVNGAGTVVVENERNQEKVRRPAAANGSFSVSIDAAVGDTLQVAFAAQDVFTQAVTIRVQAGSAAASADSERLGELANHMPAAGLDVVANGDGTVTVTGAEGSIGSGITVVVANTNGGATKADATLTGSFSAQLPASSGDSLAIFAVEPSSSQGGGPPITIAVP